MQNSTTAFTIVQFPVVVRVQRYFTTVYSIFPVSTHLPIKGASIDFAFSLSRLPLFSQKPSTFTVRSRAFASAAAPPAVVPAPPASPSDTDVRVLLRPSCFVPKSQVPFLKKKI